MKDQTKMKDQKNECRARDKDTLYPYLDIQWVLTCFSC